MVSFCAIGLPVRKQEVEVGDDLISRYESITSLCLGRGVDPLAVVVALLAAGLCTWALYALPGTPVSRWSQSGDHNTDWRAL